MNDEANIVDAPQPTRPAYPPKQASGYDERKRLADYLRAQKSAYSAMLANDSLAAAKLAIEMLAGIKPAFYLQVLADVSAEDVVEDMFALSGSMGFHDHNFMSNVLVRSVRKLYSDTAGQPRQLLKFSTKPSVRGLWGQWDYLRAQGAAPDWFLARAAESEARVINVVMAAIKGGATEQTAHGQPCISPLLRGRVPIRTVDIEGVLTQWPDGLPPADGWRIGTSVQRGRGGIGVEIAQMLSGVLHGAGISYHVMDKCEETGHAVLLLKQIKARKESSF